MIHVHLSKSWKGSELLKLIINQNSGQTESEIIINCPYVSKTLQRIIDYITQFTFSLEGELNNKIYQLPIDKIFYIESVDGKTYLYDKTNSFFCRQTLQTLEEELSNTPFARVSKTCLLNTTYLRCVEPYPNHRLKAELSNNEHIIISRNYINNLKEKIKS